MLLPNIYNINYSWFKEFEEYMYKKFNELLQQTRSMITEFKNVEQKPWGIEGSMIELSKQVGDLSKRVMVAEKYYLKSRDNNSQYKTSKNEIADELFDIWFCLVRIADHYEINLEKSIDQITKKELLSFKKGSVK
jgi:uncharacterized protein YabN with tetrapyrrole methylase and pyrophosphatase domain